MSGCSGWLASPTARRLEQPVPEAELEEAYRANALFDAHKDDPEFDYRFLADAARDAGQAMADRTAWKICSDNAWWSTFGKKKARGKGKKPGAPVHDDLCAVVDIVGYSIDSRTKSRIAVNALNSAVARRGDVAGCVVHTDRGSQSRSRKFVRALGRHDMVGSMGRVGAPGDNAAMESFFSCSRRTSSTDSPAPPVRNSGSRS